MRVIFASYDVLLEKHVIGIHIVSTTDIFDRAVITYIQAYNNNKKR